MRRLATFLLSVAVTFTGLTACPMAGLCCLPKAEEMAAHDCCQRSEAMIRSSDCCRDGVQLSIRAVNSQGRTPEVLALSAAAVHTHGQHLSVGRLALSGVELTRGLAPPGTLIAQHTSLLF